MNSRLPVAIVLAALAGACATPLVTTERRPDGIIHLKCKTPLPRCLDAAESACNHEHYAVLRAFDNHEYKGDPNVPTEVRASEAFVRCAMRGGWGDEINDLRKEPICSAPPPAAAPVPSRTCMPGATQACVGPAGCGGGQACQSDGAAFGPCDCGGAPPPRTPATP
jgi:hypothetical protein